MALKLSTRPLPRLETLLRVHSRLVPSPLQPVRHASSKPITNKSRILEKPDRFRPPSHGKRLPRARRTFGPALSEAEVHAQATKKYPNMMPAKGTFMHWLLTNRPLHLWISLGTLTSLALYTLIASFVSATHFRDQLPYSSDFLWHPFQSIRQFVLVWKLHTEFESQKVADRRRAKIEDAAKRKEFLRAHGVEPGFLTGSWMERFGTVEGDRARELLAQARDEEEERAAREQDQEASPIAADAGAAVTEVNERGPRPRRWLGLW